MKILLVTDTYLPYITGVSISTDSIARHMVSRGHKVILVCPKPLVKGEIKPLKNLKIINIPSLPFTLYNKNPIGILPLDVLEIRKIIKKEKFDIVHIQEPGITGLSALILSKCNKIPVVGALHFFPKQVDRVMWKRFENVLTPVLNMYIRFIYNKYDAIMTPSHFFEKFLKSIYVKKNICVVSNGVDTKIYVPVKRKINNRVKFFYIGRLDGDKNVETLVKAMQYSNDKVNLHIVGKGKNSINLKYLAKSLGVENKIYWKDYITDEEMVEYYKMVDVFVIMSPYEGQSIVTLQAIASGLPVIAADASALPELVKDGVNGYLVKSYDYKSLAKRINELADDIDLRLKFGEESRKISLLHHKYTVLNKLENLYYRVVQEYIDKNLN